jgi:DNA-binding CsgD family transcriptional regulator/sugar-specific transcriptional regulator TrmB
VAPPDQVITAIRRRRITPAAADLTSRYARILADAAVPLEAAQRPSALIRPLLGRDATRARIVELADLTRHEQLSIHPEVAFTDDTLAAASPLDKAAIARGVRLSVVCLPPADGDASSAHGEAMRELGVHSRYVPQLPLKLMLFDRKTALLPIDPHDLGRGALEVADPSIVDALISVFDREWAAGRDPRDRGVPPILLGEREEALITLLTAGHTDASAARRLGISARTVTYALRALMDRLGVENRFQLGLVLGARTAPLPPMPRPDAAAYPKEAS